jgi:hypothetical protein
VQFQESRDEPAYGTFVNSNAGLVRSRTKLTIR